jgi:hypothetical protein
MDITVTFDFTGHLPPASFAEFAAHRAARLSIPHLVLEQTLDRAIIRVQGPEVLVDAFEMALSLGPADCLVRDVRRTSNEGPA